MSYNYTGAMDSPRVQIPAYQLKSGMFVLYKDTWCLVYGYDEDEEALTIINARRGGLRETKFMRPDFLVTVRTE